MSDAYSKVPEQHEEEFMSEKVDTNYMRGRKLAFVLLILNIFLIGVDILYYRNSWAEVPNYRYLFFSHILYVVVLALYLSMDLVKDNITSIDEIKFKKLSTGFLLISVICWCAFLSVNAQFIHNQISAYIVCIFCIASIMLLTPKQSGLLFGLSFILFIAGLLLIENDPRQVSGTLVNSSFLVILACVVAKLNFTSNVENFVNKKTIIEKNEELKKHDKLKTIFFANISHELKTPLNLIYSAEQMLTLYSKKGIKQDKITKYSGIIKQNCFRLIRLINNLIDITKMDADEYKIDIGNHDIVKIVKDITYSVTDYIEAKNLNIYFISDLDYKVIACDPDTMERIVLNLISNAIKFTPENGEIRVIVSKKDDEIIISVADTGIGIPLEVQKTIFDRFVQADNFFTRKREGSGIGLSLVQYLVNMHQGNITLDSRPGEGTKFTISLPDRLEETEDQMVSENFTNEQIIEKIEVEFADIYS